MKITTYFLVGIAALRAQSRESRGPLEDYNKHEFSAFSLPSMEASF
jgi:hypothetical protein